MTFKQDRTGPIDIKGWLAYNLGVIAIRSVRFKRKVIAVKTNILGLVTATIATGFLVTAIYSCKSAKGRAPDTSTLEGKGSEVGLSILCYPPEDNGGEIFYWIKYDQSTQDGNVDFWRGSRSYDTVGIATKPSVNYVPNSTIQKVTIRANDTKNKDGNLQFWLEFDSTKSDKTGKYEEFNGRGSMLGKRTGGKKFNFESCRYTGALPKSGGAPIDEPISGGK